MRICVVGTGYVGLVAGAGFAEFGNDVLCADVDAEKVKRLNRGEIPIYEPGLESLVVRNTKEGRLQFTTDVNNAVSDVDVVFVAVGTPSAADGRADLSQVLNVARTVAENAQAFTIVVNKSTVPVGTADRVMAILREHGPGKDFAVVSNPEFLKEGDAVNDFMKPARVIIGTDDERARKKMRYLYEPFVRTVDRIFEMDARSAEVTKYACNAMLATRISFMNEIAALCSEVGADVAKVRVGMATDGRIGPRFLFPGVGYGGSCFPKDVKAIISTAADHGSELKILKAVEAVNERQKVLLADMVLKKLADRPAKELVVSLWGLAFKPHTDDVREAPAMTICRRLLDAGASLQLHDPVAGPCFAEELPPSERVRYFDHNFDAAQGADALLLVTEWPAYRRPDFRRLKKAMRTPLLFDGRNQWDPETVRELGFAYVGIGRP
ncbi:MAG: UDP-glucose/GDP-mannose dehydrogenase family protein [Deltaproteobacteria bacterium]|nr:UDP-glucose/GDP-mannose dehydrogenase family protein [Deltaproteobacteria bacterium]